VLLKDSKVPVWVIHVQVVKEDGDVNGTLTAYIVTYVIVTNWVVLQVHCPSEFGIPSICLVKSKMFSEAK
jgi:hypothetical protein